MDKEDTDLMPMKTNQTQNRDPGKNMLELLRYANRFAPRGEEEGKQYYEKILLEFNALTPFQQGAVLSYLRAEQEGTAA